MTDNQGNQMEDEELVALRESLRSPDPKPDSLIEEINQAVADGVLHSECCPEPNFWHWLVKDETRLSERLRRIYDHYGEIRWHGYES